MPQQSTLYAAMTFKAFVQESLNAGEVIALKVIYVQGSFEAGFWPGS